MESWKAGWDRNLQMIECSFPPGLACGFEDPKCKAFICM